MTTPTKPEAEAQAPEAAPTPAPKPEAKRPAKPPRKRVLAVSVHFDGRWYQPGDEAPAGVTNPAALRPAPLPSTAFTAAE